MLSDDHGKSAVSIYIIYLSNITSSISRDNKLDNAWIKQLSYVTAGRLNKKYSDILRSSFMLGLGKKNYINDPKVMVAFTELERNCEKHIEQMIFNAERAVTGVFHRFSDRQERQAQLSSLVSSLEYRARFFHDIIVRRAEIWGKANSLILDGYSLLEVVNSSDEVGCSECLANGSKLIDINSMSIKDLPPYHAACVCDIRQLQE
jgi:hypothetical protein